jgi:hypothetical protein
MSSEFLMGVAGVITAVATLVASAKGLEALFKVRETRAKGKTDNEVAQASAVTASWKAIQEAQNQNIIDIWAELNWLREEREFDIEYIDELHSHIDDLRDHIALGKGLPIPATPRRRKRRSPPPLSRHPAEVLAELRNPTSANQGA